MAHLDDGEPHLSSVFVAWSKKLSHHKIDVKDSLTVRTTHLLEYGTGAHVV